MYKVFLDANVLFSAAYAEESAIRKLWSLTGVQVVTSNYAFEEASRNLALKSQKIALVELGERMEVRIHRQPDELRNRDAMGLPEKDQPILWAAIDLRCAHLLTGDLKHFGALLNTNVEGVTIMKPSEFFKMHVETQAQTH
jgi:predicted nucleic acid-binding protein